MSQLAFSYIYQHSSAYINRSLDASMHRRERICTTTAQQQRTMHVQLSTVLWFREIFWANDSTGYTLVEPRHIRVPFLYRRYTHAADWPAPHFTPFRRGSARVYPAASFFVPNCTLLLRTCTLIRREIAGNKTLPPDHGITRHNKPQRPPDHGHNTA